MAFATTLRNNNPPFIQAKLTIGQPNDRYEQEADAVADQVVKMPKNERIGIQRKCADCEEEELRMKPLSTSITPIVQKKGNASETASASLAQTLAQSKSSGQVLPQATQSFMGNRIGTDFSKVKIHTGDSAIQMNRQLGAKAFTNGNNIYFNQGQYNPQSTEGKHLLAHELTHVVQQGGNSSSIQRKCDTDEALRFYHETKTGKKVLWTVGLVEELYKVVGTVNKGLYDNALASGAIDENFVALVCKAQEILGFTGDGIDGMIGENTTTSWSTWKTGGEKGINYTKLFQDKKLEIGIAIGHEFHSSEFVPIETLLLSEGFTLAHNTPAKKTYTAKKKFKVQGDNTAPDVEIDIIIECISENSSGAKATFGEFLTEKEITLYSGHARYGTGPDFDENKSVSENFVIGVNSALHAAGKLTKGYNREKNELLRGRANDLEALSKAGKFDPDLYQVWFMNACSSINYLDEIRGGLVTDSVGKKKSKENLRFMGTSKSIYADSIPIIKGLLDMDTMEEIIEAMNKYESDKVKAHGEKPAKSYYFAD